MENVVKEIIENWPFIVSMLTLIANYIVKFSKSEKTDFLFDALIFPLLRAIGKAFGGK